MVCNKCRSTSYTQMEFEVLFEKGSWCKFLRERVLKKAFFFLLRRDGLVAFLVCVCVCGVFVWHYKVCVLHCCS